MRRTVNDRTYPFVHPAPGPPVASPSMRTRFLPGYALPLSFSDYAEAVTMGHPGIHRYYAVRYSQATFGDDPNMSCSDFHTELP